MELFVGALLAVGFAHMGLLGWAIQGHDRARQKDHEALMKLMFWQYQPPEPKLPVTAHDAEVMRFFDDVLLRRGLS